MISHQVESPENILRQQTALARFGELAVMSDDLDKILTEACRLAGEALGTQLAKVVELQPDGKTLLVRAGVGWGPDVVGVATIMAEVNTSEDYALRSGLPMISPDISKETRFKYPQFLIDNNVKAVANVVIIGGQGRSPFGILQIDSHVPREFTESDTLFLQSYANLLAGAVDRIRVQREKGENAERELAALEEKVEARTRELTKANAMLQAEAVERNRVEETLRQSQKMDAVGQLTGGLAHDFNNLLAGVSSNLELIRLRERQGRLGDMTRYIDMAMGSVTRAASLTHRLLAFSRRQTLDPKATDLNRMVAGMMELFTRTLGPSIQLEAKMAALSWPVFCDPNQLENALLNLVLNARDAMPGGGTLIVETRNVDVADPSKLKGAASGNVPAGEYVSLSVSDTGSGMQPETVERAFDPFFTTKPIGEGTGLGLSMIYGFVQQSDGHVFLDSKVGEGTTVSIYLPRNMAAAVNSPDAEVTLDLQKEGRHAVVLLVEDEHAIRVALAEFLVEVGYKVMEADTGLGGLKILGSSTKIDFLLTDVGLRGGMDGHQLADAARNTYPDLKVLFMTGYNQNAAARNGQIGKGMEVIIKPFSVEALITKMDLMINS